MLNRSWGVKFAFRTPVSFVMQSRKTGVAAIASNTSAKDLRGPAWQLLLTRIGEPLMMYLLTACSVFAPLPNGCHIQLCGKPVNQASPQRSGRQAAVSVP